MNNVVPDGWSISQLGNTLEKLIAGQSPNRKEFAARSGEYGILKTTAIDWGRYIPHQNQEILDDFVPNKSHEVKCGDILITKAGPVHRVGVVAFVDHTPPKMLVSGKMTLLRTDKDHDARFISYALSTEYSQKPLKENTTGMASSQTNFTHDTLKEVPLFVPDRLKEQQKIAAILSSVDDVIEKTQAQIDKLKDLKTGMMQELLTKGIGHTEFKDSPVGRIPVEWDVQLLGSVCSFTQGVQISSDNMIREQRDGYIRYMYIRDFTGDDRLWFVEDCYPNKIITDADLAMANTGHSSGTVYKGKHGVLSNNAFKISFNQNTLNTDFLYYFLQSEFFLRKIQQLFNTAGQPHVGHANIAKMPVPIPSIKEQAKIAHAINQIVKSESEKFKKYGQLINLKKALMQDLLTGKVRVKVDQ